MERFLNAADSALRTLFATPHGSRAIPSVTSAASADSAGAGASAELSPADKALSGALMRVNHVGEVCAQALYTAQGLSTRSPELQRHFAQAAQEETDHLAWTRSRLDALGSRPSLLNPLWYAGAFGLGLLAGRLGDRVSLGFVAETEKQVEAHLQGHLDALPVADVESRAVVAGMKDDEARHAREARDAGGVALPLPVAGLMRMAARVMTTVAHRI